MSAPCPQISIVMPSLNQRRFLPDAVNSVLDRQPGVTTELLVMDPGSSDGSREWLREQEPRWEGRLRLFFEADEGQSDAVNRGMSRVRGSVLGWLNSDDRLRPGALARVWANLESRHDPAWLYGQAGVIDAEGRASSSLITRYKNLRGRRFSRFKLLQENFICQMAVFWTRPLWEQCGGLAKDKHLDMDYDLWLRFSAACGPCVLPEVLADFRVHADAKGSTRTNEQLAAAYSTAREHAASFGPTGGAALALHRILGLRTRLAYKFMKP